MKTNKENKKASETKKVINQQNETTMKTNEKKTSIEKLQEFAKSANLRTNLGTKKASIYKDDVFADLDEKGKKSLRKKIRNLLLSFVKSEVNENNIKAFNAFYYEFYKVQDYTLQSVCSENLDATKKQQINEFLNAIKKQEKA